MFLPESNDDLATILYKIVCAQKIVDDPADLNQKVQAQHKLLWLIVGASLFMLRRFIVNERL